MKVEMGFRMTGCALALSGLLFLAACTTTTSTAPDGTVTRTTAPPPVIVNNYPQSETLNRLALIRECERSDMTSEQRYDRFGVRSRYDCNDQETWGNGWYVDRNGNRIWGDRRYYRRIIQRTEVFCTNRGTGRPVCYERVRNGV